jgi:predicted O-methyltransferase YrrM
MEFANTPGAATQCIFICVFCQEEYVTLVYSLLESIYVYGNLSDDTDILIYTNTAFSNKIKNSNLFSKYLKFEINDNYNTVDAACKSRLDLFQLPTFVSANYTKVLYLDADVLITKDIRRVFDLIQKDVIYACAEGSILDPHEFWGRELFLKNDPETKDQPAFSSGILLFPTTATIRELFRTIRANINEEPALDVFHDQPFIVYNAIKHNLYDNQALTEMVVTNPTYIHNTFTIQHFCGGPGNHYDKKAKMNAFFTELKTHTINTLIEETKKYIDLHLMPIIHQCGEPLEGNIFMYHETTVYTNMFMDKVYNICNISLNRTIRNVMEIGFNAGFSALLILLSNPHIRLLCADLGYHRYTRPCFLKLKETFGDRISIVFGDSRETVPAITKEDGGFDFIHIDGGHETHIAESDILHSYRLSKPGTILIMDDYDFPHLHSLWDKYVTVFGLKPLDSVSRISQTVYHDIRRVSR